MYYTRALKGLFSSIIIMAISTCFGQENFTAYWQPAVAVNYNVAAAYSHKLSIKRQPKFSFWSIISV